MYLNGQNGFNGAPPEEISRKPPALFTAADFTVSPFDGPERGSSGETSAEKIRRHMNWIGEEPF